MRNEKLRNVAQMCLLNKSVRNIAALNDCSPSTVVKIRARLKQAGFSLIEELKGLIFSFKTVLRDLNTPAGLDNAGNSCYINVILQICYRLWPLFQIL